MGAYYLVYTVGGGNWLVELKEKAQGGAGGDRKAANYSARHVSELYFHCYTAAT